MVAEVRVTARIQQTENDELHHEYELDGEVYTSLSDLESAL